MFDLCHHLAHFRDEFLLKDVIAISDVAKVMIINAVVKDTDRSDGCGVGTNVIFNFGKDVLNHDTFCFFVGRQKFHVFRKIDVKDVFKELMSRRVEICPTGLDDDVCCTGTKDDIR